MVVTRHTIKCVLGAGFWPFGRETPCCISRRPKI
jgi:hypothetical protein